MIMKCNDIILFTVTLSGPDVFKGFLVIALPANATSISSAVVAGSFDIHSGGQSKKQCTGVSVV